MSGLFIYAGLRTPDPNRIRPFFLIYPWIKNSTLHSNKYLIINFFLSEGINEGYYESSKYCIFLQGFCYINNKAITKAKELESFLKEGINHLLKHIDTGIFNIVIFDKHSNSLIIINDRFGNLPLYINKSDKHCIISTRVDAILGCFNKDFLINLDGVKDLLTFGYLTGYNTFYKDIILLPSACKLKINLNNFDIKMNRYWCPRYSPLYDFDKLVDNIYSALRKSVNKLSFITNEKKICFLSGGMDSRTIYILHKPPVDTCNSGFINSPERKYARLVTQKGKKGKHFEFEFSENIMKNNFLESIKLTEGMQMMVASFIPYLGKKLRGYGYRLRYDGFLGGDLFGGDGFCKYQKQVEKVLYDLIVGYHQTPISNVTLDLLKDRMLKEQLPHVSTLDKCNLNKHIEKRLDNLISMSLHEFPNVKYIEDLCDLTQLFLGENRRRFRLGGLQHEYFYDVVCPFSDYDVFDEYLKIPPRYRSWRRIYNGLYNKYFKEYTQIPTTSLEGLKTTTPNTIIRSYCYLNKGLKYIGLKNEINYVDLESWLRKGSTFRLMLEKYCQVFNQLFPNLHFNIEKASKELILKTACIAASFEMNKDFINPY